MLTPPGSRESSRTPRATGPHRGGSRSPPAASQSRSYVVGGRRTTCSCVCPDLAAARYPVVMELVLVLVVLGGLTAVAVAAGKSGKRRELARAEAEVEPLAVVQRHARIGPAGVLQRDRSAARTQRTRCDAAAVAAREREPASGAADDRVAALVQQSVMVAAELNEVVEVGRAPIRPVLDVMRVNEAAARAAGEPTASVAGVERTP